MKHRVGRDITPETTLTQRPDSPLVPGHEVTQAQVNVLESLTEQAVVTCKAAGDLDLRSIDRVLSVLLQVHTRAVETRSVEESEQIQRMRMMQNIAPSYSQQASSILGIKL